MFILSCIFFDNHWTLLFHLPFISRLSSSSMVLVCLAGCLRFESCAFNKTPEPLLGLFSVFVFVGKNWKIIYFPRKSINFTRISKCSPLVWLLCCLTCCSRESVAFYDLLSGLGIAKLHKNLPAKRLRIYRLLKENLYCFEKKRQERRREEGKKLFHLSRKKKAVSSRTTRRKKSLLLAFMLFQYVFDVSAKESFSLTAKQRRPTIMLWSEEIKVGMLSAHFYDITVRRRRLSSIIALKRRRRINSQSLEQ